MDSKEFVEFMTKKRKEKGISQEQMAEFLDVSPVTMSGVEQGEIEMDIVMCIKAANILELPFRKIFDDGDYHDSRKARDDKIIRRLIIAVVILIFVNIFADVVGMWYNRVEVDNRMICTVVAVEDNILTIKSRKPGDTDNVNTVYKIELDERFGEVYNAIKVGDIIRIQYYLELSENGVNLSYKIKSININNDLQIR